MIAAVPPALTDEDAMFAIGMEGSLPLFFLPVEDGLEIVDDLFRAVSTGVALAATPAALKRSGDTGPVVPEDCGDTRGAAAEPLLPVAPDGGEATTGPLASFAPVCGGVGTEFNAAPVIATTPVADERKTH